MAEWSLRSTGDLEPDKEAHWVSQRYDTLVTALGYFGTEVLRQRTFEIDSDDASSYTLRHASHDFVFPPQPNAPTYQNSGRMYGVKPDTTIIEILQVIADPGEIKGHMIVEYGDVDGWPWLTLRDGLPSPSELPVEITEHIERIFNTGLDATN